MEITPTELDQVIQIVAGYMNAGRPSAPASADQAETPAWATILINQNAKLETILTQASDDIAQLQGDVSALTAAFTSFQSKVQSDVEAANAKATDLQTQLDAAKAAVASATAADPEAVPADVQTALDAAHTASQALLANMGGLTVTASAPTAPVADPVPEPTAPVADPVSEPEPTVATPPVDTTASPAPIDPAPAAPDTSAPTGTETPLPTT